PRSPHAAAPLTPPRLHFRETPPPADFTVVDIREPPVGRSMPAARSRPPVAPDPAAQREIAAPQTGAAAAGPFPMATGPVAPAAPPRGAAPVDQSLHAPRQDEPALVRARTTEAPKVPPPSERPGVPILEPPAPNKAAEAGRPAMAVSPR